MAKQITPKQYGKALLDYSTSVNKAAQKFLAAHQDDSLSDEEKETICSEQEKIIEIAREEFEIIEKKYKTQ